uniref:DUF4446 family protein n=1 Tax=Ndongobacter massiliensis TaxID=1871025 RepID=UPI000930D030|nr:DUF4446 family protein [Ndongobacter massiliensis]
MDWISTGISVAGAVLALAALIQVSSANQKLIRLRKRYDYLLRGRGELNLEELILRFGNDLDETRGKQRADATALQAAQEQINGEMASQRADFTAMIREHGARLSEALQEADGRLTAGHNELAQMTERRFRKLEEDCFVRFDAVNKALTKTEEDWRQAVTVLENRTQEDLKHETLLLRENLSLAVQNVALYHYNAFEDMAGEQSFSLVLLDEHGNGVLLTSIYSRRGSSSFSKDIRAGRAVQGLSPEEETALQQALSKGMQ